LSPDGAATYFPSVLSICSVHEGVFLDGAGKKAAFMQPLLLTSWATAPSALPSARNKRHHCYLFDHWLPPAVIALENSSKAVRKLGVFLLLRPHEHLPPQVKLRTHEEENAIDVLAGSSVNIKSNPEGTSQPISLEIRSNFFGSSRPIDFCILHPEPRASSPIGETFGRHRDSGSGVFALRTITSLINLHSSSPSTQP
jgi:hypothetical protein